MPLWNTLPQSFILIYSLSIFWFSVLNVVKISHASCYLVSVTLKLCLTHDYLYDFLFYNILPNPKSLSKPVIGSDVMSLSIKLLMYFWYHSDYGKITQHKIVPANFLRQELLQYFHKSFLIHADFWWITMPLTVDSITIL